MTSLEAVWYVYIIQFAGGRLYTGVTTDVVRRFSEHSGQGVRSAKALRGKGPYELVYSAKVGDKSQALKLEWSIKKMSKAEKLELIRSSPAMPC